MITPLSAPRHRVIPPSMRTRATPTHFPYANKQQSAIAVLVARVTRWAASIVHRLTK